MTVGEGRDRKVELPPRSILETFWKTWRTYRDTLDREYIHIWTGEGNNNIKENDKKSGIIKVPSPRDRKERK